MHIKVVKGTPPATNKRLCDTCAESVVTRCADSSGESVYCQQMRGLISPNVVECNRYKEDGRPSLWDMRQIAWVLDIDSKRQRIGFLNAAEWRERKPDEDIVPSHLLD